MIICIVCIILDITEIILFAIHNLMPITYLVLQCVKTAMWFIILMIAIVTTTSQQRIGDEWDNIGALVLLNGLVEAVVLSYVRIFRVKMRNFEQFSGKKDDHILQDCPRRNPHLRQRHLPPPPPRKGTRIPQHP